MRRGLCELYFIISLFPHCFSIFFTYAIWSLECFEVYVSSITDFFIVFDIVKKTIPWWNRRRGRRRRKKKKKMIKTNKRTRIERKKKKHVHTLASKISSRRKEVSWSEQELSGLTSAAPCLGNSVLLYSSVKSSILMTGKDCGGEKYIFFSRLSPWVKLSQGSFLCVCLYVACHYCRYHQHSCVCCFY